MSNTTDQGLSQPEGEISLATLATRVLIIVQGVLTVGMTIAFLPVGVVAVLVNAMLAFEAHGVNRRLFAGFAIVGAIFALLIGLGLMGVSASGLAQSTPAG